MGSIMIWVKMPIALFKLAQFVKWKPILPADGDFVFSLMMMLSNKDWKTLVLISFRNQSCNDGYKQDNIQEIVSSVQENLQPR